MTRRLFWLVMGVTIGALVVRKLSRAADRLTPSGMARSASGALSELSEAMRDFAVDVRAAMREREDALRDGAGLDGPDSALGRVDEPIKQPDKVDG
jgi:hypothetical protein